MTKSYIKIAITLLIAFIIYQCVWLNIFVFNSSYNSFIENVRILLNKETNWNAFIQSKIPPARYELIKFFTIVTDFLLLLFFIAFFSRINRFLYFAEQLLKTIGNYLKQDLQAIKQLTKWNSALFVFILISALIRSIWFALNTTIQYDEAWIYNYFIDNSFVQSFLLPSNNHKLYTSIAWWVNLLPMDKVFLIRLPNILIGLIACISLFLLLKNYFSVSIALIAMACFSSCLPVASFMPIGKSYILLLLIHIFLLRAYCSIYERTSMEKQTFWILTIIVVYGYFSNPVFLFGHTFTSLFFTCVILLRKQYVKVKQILYANLWALPAIFLLYSVDILSGSFSALAEFAITQKIKASSFFLLCIDNNAVFQTGFMNARIPFLVIVVSGLVLFFNRKIKNRLLLLYAVISIIWLPFYAAIVKDDTSVHKTIYITVSFVLILVFLCEYAFGKLIGHPKIIWLTSLIIIYTNIILIQKNPWFNWSLTLNDSVQQVSKILLKNNAQSCYLSQFYYKPGLQFNFRTQKKSLRIFMGVPGSIDYVENIPENPHPNFLIISKETMPQYVPSPGYTETYSDNFVVVYKYLK